MRKTVISVLFLAILVGLAMLGFQKFKPTTPLVQVVVPQAGLVVEMPQANDLVVSPLVVSGYVDGKDRWTGFEGQVGTVQLLDGNGKLLVLGILTATAENWMQFPTSFSTTLTFSAPATATGTLVFKNENPSGMSDYEREFRLPVKFK